MEITEDHAEYAVVERFRDMLNGSREPYRVTSAYAFFTAILCWSAQRMRSTPEANATACDIAANRLWQGLGGEVITDAPWGIRIATSQATGNGDPPASFVAVASAEFKDHTVDRFIKNLRDAVAHGDARNVRPINHGGKLRGFEFCCSERRKSKIVWSGKVVLLGNDMVRVADEIAARFCREMEASTKQSYLKVDSRNIEEAA